VEVLVRTKVLVTAVAGLMIAAAPARAQQQTRDVDPARVRELVQQALQQTAPAPAPAGQAQTVTSGPKVDLSIQDATQRGLEKNIDISVARLTPRTWDFTIAGLEATYRPNLTSLVSNTSRSNFPTSQTQGISAITRSGTAQWQGGLAQNLWWGGTAYSIGFTNSRTNSPSSFNFRNPQYNSSLTASLTQPLLRGFRTDSTRTAILTDRLSQSNDEIALQSTIATTVANTRSAYWDLVYAIQAVVVAQQSLDLSNKLVTDNRARVEIGTLAPIDVVSAQAEEATRRQALVLAVATQRTSELALKRLIVSGTDDPLWTASINPTDRPDTAPQAINLEAAVTRALRERTDLQQAQNSLKINDINLRNQVDLTRPSLTVNASYGLGGLGGTQFIRSGGLGSPIIDTIPSGYFDALRNIAGFDAPTWTLSMNFAYPLGLSSAEANVARSKLTIEQTQAQMKSLQLQIATDVTNAALTVQSDLEAVQASGVARELAQKKMEAAQSKFEVGMATNYEVVQAQRDLRDAQNTELRAVLNYRKALVNFETVQTVSPSRGGISNIGVAGGGAQATGGTAVGGQAGGGGQ
jgi:outer membrane protein